jgi:hypothetical protein
MSGPVVNWSLCLNADPARADRDDLRLHLARLNPILQDILAILETRPDTAGGHGPLPPNFSKIMFTKVG